MNTLLGRLLLWQKFLLLAVLGGLLLALPFSLFLHESNLAIAVARQEARGIAPTRALVLLVRDVQQHRGLSAMLDTGYREVGQRAVRKQADTVQAFIQADAAMRQVDDAAAGAAFQLARAQWTRLLAARTLPASTAPSPADNFATHSLLIAQLLLVQQAVVDHYGLRLAPDADSYFLVDAVLVEAPRLSEMLGQLRGSGAAMLAAGHATPAQRMALYALGERARYHADTIDGLLQQAMNANAGLRAGLAPLAQANLAASGRALELAQQALVRPERLTLDPWEYFVRISDALDTQQQLSDAALTALGAILQHKAENLSTIQYSLIALLLALLLPMVALSRKIVLSVTRPLASALAAAHGLTRDTAARVEAVVAIADGDLDRALLAHTVLDIDATTLSRNEVGKLMQSLVSMSSMQRTLDDAFEKMTSALRRVREAERVRDWLKSGQNELSDLMREVQDSGAMGQAILAYLAQRVGAGAGAFYVYQPQQGLLLPVAGYALAPQALPQSGLGLGQGLLGQAAQARRILCLHPVPADYVVIQTALVAGPPATVAAVPLWHADTLVGALELCAFKQFSPTELEFLERARESIAVALGVSLARQRTEALLEQTQHQAEELQLQQQELQQINEELAQRAHLLEHQREQIRAKNEQVEAASEEIRRKAASLEQANAYKSQFLANMSHELRTPLNSMLILSGILHANQDGNLSPTQVDYAATIRNAGTDLLNLINDILDLSKVEAGRVELHYETVPPASLCDTLESLFRPVAASRALSLALELAPDVPAALTLDVAHTQQVLKNLLSNAIKFTAEGGVGLRIALADAAANPLPGAALSFAVRDSGIGIAPDKQQLIFEAFKQADGAINRSYGGTGLGLSISLQLARAMGGELRVASVPGQGSTFTLYLPLTAPAAQPPCPPSPAPPPAAGDAMRDSWTEPDDRAGLQRGDKSILIIEDNLHFARVLAAAVREHGYPVLIAADGESGLALAQRYLPAAILLDVYLPRIDGWTVARHLKEQSDTQAIPVHFLTCVEDSQRALDMGAVGFLTKPISPAQLDGVFRTIETALARAVRRVLVVEDDADQAGSLLALLSERDVLVQLAASGATALTLLESERYDCMVLDLGLGDMSGLDVLRRIQDMERASSIPVIVHAGRAPGGSEQLELDRYADRFLLKGSASPERLRAEVAQFLHRVDGPAATAAPPAAPVPSGAALPAAAPGLAGIEVLLVDDDMRNVFSLASLLSAYGARTVEAENGQVALAQLAAHPAVKLVLMDIMMPEMDGYAAMRQIRANPAWRALPIVAMTAQAMAGDRERCLAAGASDYLSKPIDSAALLAMLQGLLDAAP